MPTLPILRTPRLALVPYGTPPADADAFCRITTHPDVYWWRRPPYTVAEQRQHFEDGALFAHVNSGLGSWAVFAGDTLLGQVMLTPMPETLVPPASLVGNREIGWHFLPEARGQGHATEAARAILGYGFRTLGLDQVACFIVPENKPSLGVAARLGFERAGEAMRNEMPHIAFALRAPH